MIFHIGLLFHIIGIFLIAGGSIGNLVVEKLFWHYIGQVSEKSKTLSVLLSRFPKIILTGSMLMLASGLLMLYSVNWTFWGQTWLTIKLCLYSVLLFNGLLIAGPTLAKIVSEVQSPQFQMQALLDLKKKMTRFHIIQFSVFLLLLIVVIFKI